MRPLHGTAPLLCLAAFTCTGLLAQGALPSAKPSFSDPAISPDGHEITFVSGGDLWSVAAEGGQAHLLVGNPATESRPLYSPDGTRLAFVSNRTGANNIYLLTLATGQLQRLTYSSAGERLDGWSHDGEWVYFTSSANDVAGQGDIFRVKSSGGTPLEVVHERYMNEFESAPSPAGAQVAFVAKGISGSQWWRDGHAHIDETEVWLKPVAESGSFRKLLPADMKHGWPMWSADGKTLYYMGDGTGSGYGTENIWGVAVAGGQPHELTHFKQGRVLWPSIGNGGKTIVFERDFGIWRLDTASGKAEPVRIELRGSGSGPVETRVTETAFRSLALSPDGKKVAVLAHGKVFAAGLKEGGEGHPVHTDAVAALNPRWSPDSSSLLYIAERPDGAHQLELFDYSAGKVRVLTTAAGYAEEPVWSPDGRSITYVQDDHDLHVLTVPDSKAVPTAKNLSGASIQDRIIAHGELENPSLAWSPDGQWIVFTATDARSFRNLHVVPAAGGAAQPITFLANGETASRIAWSPDGTYILFDTAQRSEQVQIARVDLLPHVPRYREDQFRDLFREQRVPGSPSVPPNPGPPATPETQSPAPETPVPETPAPEKPTPGQPADETATPGQSMGGRGSRAARSGAAPARVEPVRIVFAGIRQRLTILPLGLSAERPVISPDGKTLLFSASAANQQQLYTYTLDELSREPAVARQLTSTPGGKRDYAWTSDSKEVVFLESSGGAGRGGPGAAGGGGIRVLPVESRVERPVNVTGRLDVDFDQEKQVVFQEAWTTLDRRFYDKSFHGHDWKALHDAWQPYITGSQTPDELRRNINLLIGELDSSHSGINGAPSAGDRVLVGRLGLRFDREAYEAGRGLVVREVIALGPAAIEGSIKPGDKLVSINGDAIGSRNLDQMLEDTAGRRTSLGVETAGKLREAVVRPVADAAASGLLYRQWVEERRAYVDKISGGRVGYVHMAAMGDSDLQQLYLDLDAQNEGKQGVVVDIRNNNGGYINGYALDVFTRRNYLEMTPRTGSTHPSRQELGQRALGVPTVLVTNESTLSDGEDFTEGYRSLKLGPVIGEPTAGWIIFTGAQPLIDGSSVRVPFTRVQDLRGQTMEGNPRPVDQEMDREEGESSAGVDRQLDLAVKALLSR